MDDHNVKAYLEENSNHYCPFKKLEHDREEKSITGMSIWTEDYLKGYVGQAQDYIRFCQKGLEKCIYIPKPNIQNLITFCTRIEKGCDELTLSYVS